MSTLTDAHLLRIFGRALLAVLLVFGSLDNAWLGAASAEQARPEVGRADEQDQADSPSQRTPRTPRIKDGLIAGFEDGEIGASFGSGWTINADSVVGGSSAAEMVVVEGGAVESDMSLRITGTLVSRSGEPVWAGAMFYPGRRPFGAANMSAYAGILFWVRGDGSPFTISLFAQGLGQDPVILSRPTTAVWTEHRLAFSEFDGVDATGLKAVLFSGAAPGDFEFQIDELRVW